MSRKTPIQFDTFLKLNESTAKDKLQNGDVWKSENIVFDKVFGKVRARGDFNFKYDPDQPDSIIDVNNPIGTILDTKDKDGNIFTLVGNGTRIDRTNWLANFSACKTGLSSAPYFKHTQFGDGLLITNGIDAPFRLSGTGFNTSDPLEIQAPNIRNMHVQRVSNADTLTSEIWNGHLMRNTKYKVTHFVAGDDFLNNSNPFGTVNVYISGGTGIDPINSEGAIFRTYGTNHSPTIRIASWANGSELQQIVADNEQIGELDARAGYRYAIVYKDDKGNISPPSIAIKGVITDEYDRAYNLTDIPVSSDSRVTSKMILRTEGDGETFYLLDEIENSITIYEDQKPDEDLDFTVNLIYVRCPEKAEYILQHNNKIFLGNIWLRNKFFTTMTFVSTPAGADTTGNLTGSTYTDFGLAILGMGYPLITYDVGNVLAGYIYKYLVTFVDADGLESDPVISRAVLVPHDGGAYEEITEWDAPAFAEYCTVKLFHVPCPDGFQNATVFKRKIYRSEGQLISNSNFDETTVTFRLIAEQNKSVYGYFTDAFTDTYATPTDEYNYTGAELKHYPSGVAFSRGGRDATFYLEDVRQVDQNDPDEIVGMGDGGSGVIFWKKNNIYKIYTGGLVQNWYLRKYYENVGCDEPQSIAIQGATAYFMHNRKIYQMSQEGYPEQIGIPIKPSLDILTSIISAEATDKWYVLLGQYNATYQYVLAFDVTMGTWYKFPFVGRKLEGVGVKKYTAESIDAGTLIIAFNKTPCIYDPDTYLWIDNYSTGNTNVAYTMKLGFPMIQLGGTTNFRLRKIITNFKRITTGSLQYLITDNDTGSSMGTITDSDSDQGIKRIGATKDITSKLYVEMTGRFSALEAIKFILRPVMRGLR